MSISDKTHRFLFDDTDVRGEIVTLDAAFKQSVAHQNLCPGLKALLGDFLSAAALLSESMKFEGLLTLQARGDGTVPLIMAEATNTGQIRGIVKSNSKTDYQDKPALDQVLGKAILTLTIDPTKGERYQGIVPLDQTQLADCLSHYFMASEQLPTKLWLYSQADKCGGLMLQSLPAQVVSDKDQRDELWSTLTNLADTATAEEVLNLEHETMLFRLFHEMKCRLFPARQFQYQCSCTRERSGNAIVSLGYQEAIALFSDQTEVSIDCQFCGQAYNFNLEDVKQLFSSSSNVH